MEQFKPILRLCSLLQSNIHFGDKISLALCELSLLYIRPNACPTTKYLLAKNEFPFV